MTELSTVYARSGDDGPGLDQDVTEDVIGQIQFEFVDWQERRPATVIMNDIRDRTADIPGIKVEVTAPQGGPPTGKPIQVQLSSDYPDALRAAALEVAGGLAKRPEIRDLDNGLPIARHRLAARDRQGRGRQIRNRRRRGRRRSAARHQRSQDHRLPAADQRQAGRHHPACAGGPAHADPDRRPARADGRRRGADRQFHQPRTGAAHGHHPPCRRQARHHGHRQPRRRDVQTAAVQAGDHSRSWPRPTSKGW